MKEVVLDLEKLREEILNMVDYWNEDTSLMRNDGVEAIIRKIKQHIKAACKFYLKYKDKPELLGKDYPFFVDKIDEIYKKRIEAEEALGPNYEPSSSFTEEYNNWLFKEAFKCILEEKENE